MVKVDLAAKRFIDGRLSGLTHSPLDDHTAPVNAFIKIVSCCVCFKRPFKNYLGFSNWNFVWFAFFFRSKEITWRGFLSLSGIKMKLTCEIYYRVWQLPVLQGFPEMKTCLWCVEESINTVHISHKFGHFQVLFWHPMIMMLDLSLHVQCTCSPVFNTCLMLILDVFRYLAWIAVQL